MPGLAEVGDSKGERKALLNRSVRNVRISQLHKADYEAYWLRKSRREVKWLAKMASHCRTFAGHCAISREIREWCERERILLRIPLPQAAKAPEPRRVSGAVSYSDVPRSGSLVMEDATPAEQPATPVVPPAK
jgi:hypothetical protein